MLASITLSDLTLAAPDGEVLLDNLNLVLGPRRTGLVGRNGIGKSTLLRLVAGEAPLAGSVTREGRVAMLRQEVQLRPGETLADAFGIAGRLALLDRIDAGTAGPEALGLADWSLPARFESALAGVGLPPLEPDHPMAALSGGQRTRVALAALVFDTPDMILMDEPTNNLDVEGRAAVAELLERWHGGAVVVSHDRALLERMDAIVELSSLGARTYGGNFTAYRARKTAEEAAIDSRVQGAEQALARTTRKVQEAAERKARKDASGKRSRRDGGAPKMLLDARKERAEGTGGGMSRLADRLMSDAASDLAQARAEQERVRALSLELAPTGLAAGRRVLEARGLAGGPDPGHPVIHDLDLVLTGPERLAVTGPNGSGKTTLLRLLTGDLEPAAGFVRIGVAHAFLDQTMRLLDPAATLLENFRRLNPEADENTCRAALARFLFRGEAALRPAGTLSGGQTLRAGLACALGGARPPELLILDEPTNHLDLNSIMAVEAALASYDGALIVVSHDRAFLESVGVGRELAL